MPANFNCSGKSDVKNNVTKVCKKKIGKYVVIRFNKLKV